jgi:hypothetical protein
VNDRPFTILKLISGGQTGADRAALDVALALGIACGGFVPRGRRAEDGPLDPRYPVTELADAGYDARTTANVRAADATLLISLGPLTGGSALTWRRAQERGQPILHVDRSACARAEAVERIRGWLSARGLLVLNVAGPRESTAPGIYAEVRELLLTVLGTPRG